MQHPAALVDIDALGPDDRRLAHSPRDDGGVRDYPAPGGKDPVGGVETAHVLRRGLVPDQDDVVAALREDLRLLGVEGDLARGGAGRGRDAGGDEPAVLARLLLLFGVEGRLEQLVQALGVAILDHRLPRRDDALLDHVGDDLERGPAGAPSQSAGLQDKELAALDGELHVLRVPEVALQGFLGSVELAVGSLQLRVVLHLLDGLPGPDAGHHVLALRVGQVLARDDVISCQGLRVKQTPVAPSSPRLPKTMETTLTAETAVSGILFTRRKKTARSE